MKKHVLVVDSAPHSRYEIADSLKSEGFLISEAEDGREALSSIVEKFGRGEQYNLVLVSVRMQGMSDMGLIHELYENNIPVPTMVISDFLTRALITELVRNCCSDLLLVPFDQRELVKRVKDVLEKHEGGSLN